MQFLEKTKQINAIKLDIPWSDLGSWKEILKMYDKNKNKYYKKKMFITGLGVGTLIYSKVKVF